MAPPNIFKATICCTESSNTVLLIYMENEVKLKQQQLMCLCQDGIKTVKSIESLTLTCGLLGTFAEKENRRNQWKTLLLLCALPSHAFKCAKCSSERERENHSTLTGMLAGSRSSHPGPLAKCSNQGQFPSKCLIFHVIWNTNIVKRKKIGKTKTPHKTYASSLKTYYPKHS